MGPLRPRRGAPIEIGPGGRPLLCGELKRSGNKTEQASLSVHSSWKHRESPRNSDSAFISGNRMRLSMVTKQLSILLRRQKAILLISISMALIAILVVIRAERLWVYVSMLVYFSLGLWIGIVAQNNHVPLGRSVLESLVYSLIILTMAFAIASCTILGIYGLSKNALSLVFITIWGAGGGSFLLWIIVGTLIRIS